MLNSEVTMSNSTCLRGRGGSRHVSALLGWASRVQRHAGASLPSLLQPSHAPKVGGQVDGDGRQQGLLHGRPHYAAAQAGEGAAHHRGRPPGRVLHVHAGVAQVHNLGGELGQRPPRRVVRHGDVYMQRGASRTRGWPRRAAHLRPESQPSALCKQQAGRQRAKQRGRATRAAHRPGVDPHSTRFRRWPR